MMNQTILNKLTGKWDKFSCQSCQLHEGKVLMEVELEDHPYTLLADEMDFIDFLMEIDAIEFWENYKVTFEVSKGLDDSELCSLPLDEFLDDFPIEEDITRALDGTMSRSDLNRSEFLKMLMKTPAYEAV